MTQIPPEIKALIVDKIWHSRDPEPSLSALGLVWKDATPFIRAHRFYEVDVTGWKTLPRLIALKDDAAQPLTLIRKFTVHSTESDAKTLILSALNVETLTFVPSYSLSSIASLATHTNLTALTLLYGDQKFTTLMDLLQSIPRLTSLTLSHFRVVEFHDTASRVWPFVYDEEGWYEEEEHFFLERCAPMSWEKYKFPQSDPLPNISHLSLDISRADHLWFLDFVCSPKSPFRDLQRLDLSDIAGSFMAARVDAVLKKYSSSLVEFRLHADSLEGKFPDDSYPFNRMLIQTQMRRTTSCLYDSRFPPASSITNSLSMYRAKYSPYGPISFTTTSKAHAKH